MKRYLTILGLLLVGLALVSCSAGPDGLSEPAEAAADAGASAETPKDSDLGESLPAVIDNQSVTDGYQEGFTADGEPYKGNPEATVVIEEFSSYQCPFCARFFQQTYPQLMVDYVETGLVKYIFRDYPLPSQPQSPLAAEAAACAGNVGGGSAFWQMHDRLFQGQREWSGRGDALEIFQAYADEQGLDRAAFVACLESGAMSEQVSADAREGSTRGVTGTPTFFINGRALVGAQPYEAFQAVIDAALSGEAVPAAPSQAAPVVTPTPAAIAPVDPDRVLGEADAPVTIVEFTDYQCPFCARHSAETWPQLKAQFVDTGRVRYELKDFPIAQLHPQAAKAHEAARCAGDQGSYWEMHDVLFDGQGEWSGETDPSSVLKGYADRLGLDALTFADCLDGGHYADEVAADVAEGARLGVSGTPTFFIDGYPVVGAQPYDIFEYAIGLAEQGTLGAAFKPRQ